MLLVMEPVANGSLLDYVRNNKKIIVSNGTNGLIDMASQVAQGMAYLEAQNFVHGDLRAVNVLVGERNRLKIADFGLMQLQLQEFDKTGIENAEVTAKLPVKWMAPEVITTRLFSTKSDVWSFGILLYEMLTCGRTPYPGMDKVTTLQRVQQGYRMPRPTGQTVVECPAKMYEKMLQCWKKKPEDRLTFECLYHFFDDYTWVTEDYLAH